MFTEFVVILFFVLLLTCFAIAKSRINNVYKINCQVRPTQKTLSAKVYCYIQIYIIIIYSNVDRYSLFPHF